MKKYENLFNSLPNVGGISGVTYKAYIENGMVVKLQERPRFLDRRSAPERDLRLGVGRRVAGADARRSRWEGEVGREAAVTEASAGSSASV